LKVSIHQPDFLPWFGVFSKIAKTDKFVVFDNINSPQGKSWLTRNRILLDEKQFWMTVPVYKGKAIPIRELKIADGFTFKRKHLGALKSAYKKANHFPELFPQIENVYQKTFTSVAEFNMELVQLVMRLLCLKPTLVWASELMTPEETRGLKGNAMVLELARRAGATTYISGTGCKDFILPEEFEKSGIEFIFNEVSHPKYRQSGNSQAFVTDLSIIDLLFNLGPSRLNKLLRAS